MAYKKRTYRKKKTSYRKKGGTVKRAVRKAKKQVFSKKVKSVINRMSETKVVNNATINKAVLNWDNDPAFQNSIITLGSGSSSSYLFSIGQGVGQGSRVGNKISTQKMMIRGSIRFNTQANTSTNYNPIPGYVTMWIVKLKPFLNDDIASLQSVIDGSFFQSGNGSVGMTGGLADMYRLVNSDQITVLKRRMWKLGVSAVINFSGSSGGGGDTVNQNWGNNDFKLTHFFKQDLSKCVPKTMTFNDSNNNFLERRSYLFFSFIRMNDTIPVNTLGFAQGIVPAYVDFEVDYMYKDV